MNFWLINWARFWEEILFTITADARILDKRMIRLRGKWSWDIKDRPSYSLLCL